MSSQSNKVDAFALRLADFVIRRRWFVIAFSIGLLAAFASGARFLEFSNNYRVFFSAQNPDLVAFDNFQNTYTKNDNLIFVLQPRDGQVFSPNVAEAIERLTAEAWKIPFAIRVDSISNYQHSWADGDDLTVEDLIVDGSGYSPSELEAKKTIALAEPLLRDNLISSDADTTGVNVTLQYPEKSLTEVPEAVAYARGLADEIRAAYPDLRVVVSGLTMLNNAFAESGQTDAKTLIPLMYAVLVGLMLVALRSVLGTLATLLVVAFSTATALGAAGHLGIKLSPSSVVAPTIILTLAIADSIHILISMLAMMREGQDRISALKESLRINFLAVSITSLTTVVGFLCLNFSDAPPFWDLGNITAIGIVAAWIYSLTFLPAVISLLPIKARNRSDRGARGSSDAMDRLSSFVIRRSRPILVASCALTLGLVAMIPTIDLNDEWVKYFDHRLSFRGDAEFAIENLNGLYQVEFSVEAEEAEGIGEPAYLERLDAFTVWLREQPEVRHVYSYSDIAKRLNMNLHGDDRDWYKLPERRDLAAQYLLLYELSLPYGLDLNDRINIDKSATRVTATVDDLSTVAMRDFTARAKGWLEANTPSHMHARPTGAIVMFSHISERNINAMLRGNAVAVVMIAIIMMISLRSLPLGTLSLLPNAIPILMTFGLWAILVGKVGVAAATVSATSLGIIVDNTVHFLTKYLRARREKGLQPPEAITYAFRTVGMAILVNAFILSIGFAVLAFSTFRVNSEMGLLTALAVVIALVVDFLFLPSLLLIGSKSKKGEHHAEPAPAVGP